MTMNYKRCNNCGSVVDKNSKFCPNCNSQSFKKMGEVVEVKSSPTHRLLYWRYDNHYVLAKSKVLGIGVFIAFIIGAFTGPYGAVTAMLGVIFALMAFLVCYLFHFFLSRPSKAQLENTDDGFIPDLVHTLFFWQDSVTGAYFVGKTKLITVVLFAVFAISAAVSTKSFIVGVIAASIVSVPAFIIGFLIHRFTYKPGTVKLIKSASKPKEVKKTPEVESKSPEIKVDVPEDEIDPKLIGYQKHILTLKEKYATKDDAVRQLIEKRFAPPQLTYTRFITSVDKVREMFEKQSASALNIISLASEYSPRIEEELDSKIDILNTIISKLDDLANELVITMDDSKEEDMHVLIDDMDDLIDSVDDYK